MNEITKVLNMLKRTESLEVVLDCNQHGRARKLWSTEERSVGATP
jgi:hypothetical protein